MKEERDARVPRSWHLLPVFGLVCMGALILAACGGASPTPWPTPALPDGLPHSPKGYELYSWQAGEAWRFTFITGTNRSKRYDEIAAVGSAVTGTGWVKVSVEGRESLVSVLERLPVGEVVRWHSGRRLEGTGGAAIVLPDRALVQEIEATCQRLGVQLEIAE